VIHLVGGAQIAFIEDNNDWRSLSVDSSQIDHHSILHGDLYHRLVVEIETLYDPDDLVMIHLYHITISDE
jgi:hypothetical protein